MPPMNRRPATRTRTTAHPTRAKSGGRHGHDQCQKSCSNVVMAARPKPDNNNSRANAPQTGPGGCRCRSPQDLGPLFPVIRPGPPSLSQRRCPPRIRRRAPPANRTNDAKTTFNFLFTMSMNQIWADPR
jgi:hypothetical protein